MNRILSHRASWLGVLVAVVVALGLMAGGSDVARAQETVIAGHDLLETVTEQGIENYIDFAATPLPTDFFGPGSDPFDGRVYLQGDPFDSFGGFSELSPTDTIWERLESTGESFPATIDVEIVELALVSVEPITVTYDGGMDPEFWDVRVQVLNGEPEQVPGTMTIRHEGVDGGTFDIELPIQPRLIFTKVSDPGTQVYYDEASPMEYVATGEPWCHTANPLSVPSGQVVIEKPGLTTNFFPGIDCGPPRTKTVVGLDADIGQNDYAHQDVQAAENEADEPVGGIAEFPPDQADTVGGSSSPPYAAFGAVAAALVILMAGGGWYARRRSRAG